MEEGKADEEEEVEVKNWEKVKVCQTYQLSEPGPHKWEISRALIGINNGHACECMSSRVKAPKVVPHFRRLYIVFLPIHHHSC